MANPEIEAQDPGTLKPQVDLMHLTLSVYIYEKEAMRQSEY